MGKAFEARNGALTAWVQRLYDPEDSAPSYRLWCLGPDGEPVYCSRWEWGYASRAYLATLAVDWCAHGVTPVNGEADKPQRGSVRSDAWDSPARWRRERRKVWFRDYPNMDRFEQWGQ